MTISSAERKARAGLPVVRLMQAYLPINLSRWLLKQGMARVRLDDEVNVKQCPQTACRANGSFP